MEELKIDWPAFTRFYNATLKLHGSAIPPLTVITKGKRVQIQRIVNALGTKQALVDAVVNMARSDFLNGRTRTPKFPRGFIASFPWLMANDERIADVANGKYDNPPVAELTPDEQRQLEAERYRQQQDARRAENRAIEEEVREEQRQRREERARGAVSYEEYQRMKQQGLLNET